MTSEPKCIALHLAKTGSKVYSKELYLPVRTPQVNSIDNLVAVHAGPLKFCETFLGTKDHPEHFQRQLCEAMSELLDLAKAGLQINAGLIRTEQLPLQEMLEDKWQTMSAQFQVEHHSHCCLILQTYLKQFKGMDFTKTRQNQLIDLERKRRNSSSDMRKFKPIVY